MSPDIKIGGRSVNMMDCHLNFTKDAVDIIRSTYGNSVKVYDIEIPMSVIAIECGDAG